jgi:hypothetical protein
MTVYATQPNVLPSVINYACRYNWVANTLFKELTATTTPSSSSTPAVASNPLTTPSSVSAGTPPEQEGGASGSSSSPSKAWIAGAVVGPLVLLGAVIAGLLFWRRQRNKKRDASQTPPLTQKIGSSHQPSELPGQHQTSELPATGY